MIFAFFVFFTHHVSHIKSRMHFTDTVVSMVTKYTRLKKNKKTFGLTSWFVVEMITLVIIWVKMYINNFHTINIKKTLPSTGKI